MVSKAQQIVLDITGQSDYHESGSSDEIYMTCPFCRRKNKFYLNSKGKFICFVCTIHGGSLASFVMQYEKCSFAEAKRILKDQDYETIDYSQQHTQPDEGLFSKLVQIKYSNIAKDIKKTCPALPTNVKYLKDNMDNKEAYPFLWYLKKRGVTLQQIHRFNIGYVNHGKLKTKNNKIMPVNNSILFPTYNQLHKMVYWNTRSIEPHPYVKSLNAFSKPNEYSKKDVVWNMDQVRYDSYMVICEGVFNAITCSQDNYVGVATFGKNIVDSQIDLMTTLNPERYYLFLDNDAKNLEAELAKKLTDKGISTDRIYLVNNPYGEADANDLGMIKVKELLDDAQPIGLISFLELIKR